MNRTNFENRNKHTHQQIVTGASSGIGKAIAKVQLYLLPLATETLRQSHA